MIKTCKMLYIAIKPKLSFIALFAILLCSQSYAQQSVLNDAVNIAIDDFSQIHKFRAGKYSVFDVDAKDCGNFWKIYITGELNKLPIYDERVEGKYPTRYRIVNNHLYYWQDAECSVSDEMVRVLADFDVTDSLYYEPSHYSDRYTDDGDCGRVYYICKCNINRYKRRPVNSLGGHYDEPNLRCCGFPIHTERPQYTVKKDGGYLRRELKIMDNYSRIRNFEYDAQNDTILLVHLHYTDKDGKRVDEIVVKSSKSEKLCIRNNKSYIKKATSDNYSHLPLHLLNNGDITVFRNKFNEICDKNALYGFGIDRTMTKVLTDSKENVGEIRYFNRFKL